ncbi:hypothetical protein A2Y99_02165 [Candidatus Gottesmanbacteria bacterium RBG_13_37_7]|uniref:Uncharacterized protein n=1 Tax=Candidatus Gottesmanbacteria bacterium RBG_13_37_7 TaxID=1798369 RepID=A0A1F5YJH9_9BACT|nr:MAG: hypothetical protein A2Y99_02165 [Candidatus Gottesmanbacteria bacterium RBG_13_37_7]
MINLLKKRVKLLIIVAVLIFLLYLLYQNFFLKNTSNKTDSVILKRGTLTETLTISGNIDADEKATLRFKTSGMLNWIGVKEGDFVKKYQGIASLDQREVKKQLQKDLNDYMNERWDFDQTKDDNENKVRTDSVKRVLEKAQFDLNNTVLDVEVQNLAVEYSFLWTPIEGIVTRVASPFAGVYITPAQAEFDIVNPSSVYFSALADQTEVIKLYQGLVGELILDAFPDESLTGNVKNISFIPKSGETGIVYLVKFAFDKENSSYRYRIGMAGDLNFTIRSKDNVLFLPLKYVKEKDGKKYVEMMINGKKEKKYVTVGMETDEDIEIISGLDEGTEVLN